MKSFKKLFGLFVLVFAFIVLAGCQLPWQQQAHEHSFGEWKVTKQATCLEAGEQTRTCECGAKETKAIDALGHDFGQWQVSKAATCDAKGEEKRVCSRDASHVETREIPALGHNLQVVALVPATAEQAGVKEHYKCSVCNKLFDENKKAIEAAGVIEKLEVAPISAPVLGKLNAAGDIQIYDGKVAIDKGDIDSKFIFGIDANGKIIVATFFGGAGYGGPSDGFYHDGNYALEAGKVCGIFRVDADFAPWPATAVKNGEQVNAWTLYEVVAPEGGYLIAVGRDKAVEFVKALTGDEAFVNEDNNGLFEDRLFDGDLNGFTVFVEKGIENAAFYAVKGKAEAKAGLNYKGTNTGSFEALEDGTFKFEMVFGEWNRIAFDWVDEEGNVTPLWYDNTTFSGDVTDADTIGADWTYNLYHEDDPVFFNWRTDSPKYEFIYNPVDHTMVITCLTKPEEVDFEVAGVKFGGSKEGNFELQEDGTFVAIIEDLAQWSHVNFTAMNAAGEELVLFYNNTKFTGAITAAEIFGCDWTANLYHEEDSDNEWIVYVAGTSYKCVFDPESFTMNISTYAPIDDDFVIASVQFGGKKSGEFTLQEDGTYVAIIEELAQWSHVNFKLVDADGNEVALWYDNTTFEGAITAADKLGCDWTANLYHEADSQPDWLVYVADSSYKCVYNPDTKVMVISLYVPEEPVEELKEEKFMDGASNADLTVYGYLGGFINDKGAKQIKLVVSGEGTLETLRFTDQPAEQTKYFNQGVIIAPDGSVVESTLQLSSEPVEILIDIEKTGMAEWPEIHLHSGGWAAGSITVTAFFLFEEQDEPVEIEVAAVKYDGVKQGDFVLREDGLFFAEVELSAWNRISFKVVLENEEELVLWYDNATFSGAITAEDVTGDQWNGSLYHEDGDGEQWMPGQASTYRFFFDASKMEMKVVLVKDVEVKFGGAKQGSFELQEDGLFFAEVELAAWNRINFTFVNEEGEEIVLWYNNATFSGAIVAEDVTGDQWDGSLYHEDGDGEQWMPGQASTYRFYFDLDNMAMRVALVQEPEMKFGGAKQGSFELKEDGSYFAEVELAAWNRINFTYVNDEGEEIVLWYDNATFSGAIVAEDVTGDQWDGSLYHEDGDGEQWMPGQASTYRFFFDASKMEMKVVLVKDVEVKFGGEKQGNFELREDGLFFAEVELAAWKRISFELIDEVGESTVLWYDNTTFTGAITAEDVTGDQWDGSLYHEDGDGQRWMPGQASTYRFYFDLENMAMRVVLLQEPEMKFGGAKQGSFELREDGLYFAEVELGAWNRINFTYVNDEGEEIVLWYDNVTFSGAIAAEDVTGDQWDGKLYHEDGDGEQWMPGQASTYRFYFDLGNMAMRVALIQEPEMKFGGAKQGNFELKDGLYVAEVELAAWNRINFAYVDEEGESTVLWYDNATFTGAITAEDVTGDQWDGSLYHEDGDGEQWMPGQASTYRFFFDLDNMAMRVVLVKDVEVKFGGEKQGNFELREDGLFFAEVELAAWKRISFELIDEVGESTVLWYDNTTFTGAITAEDVTGDQWDGSLYHEDGDGQRWMPGEASTYRFYFDLDNMEMRVALLREPQMKFGGAKEGDLELREDGLYFAEVELAAWNRINFTYTNDEGEETVLWYDNTTFTGAITAEDVTGDQWDGKLYHEDGDGEQWMPGQASTYRFYFDASNMAMRVALVQEPQMKYGGEKQGNFVLQDGLYVVEVELAAWKRINFTYVDDEGTPTVLWYDNTTFAGDITAESVSGDQWNGSLYHEDGDGKQWMPGQASKYKFEYDLAAHKMTVTLRHDPQVNYGGAYTGSFTKQDNGTFVATVTVQKYERISFTYIDEEGNATSLWYDNTEFQGLVNSESDDWSTTNLFYDGGEHQFKCGAARTYSFEYNPQTHVMVVS